MSDGVKGEHEVDSRVGWDKGCGAVKADEVAFGGLDLAGRISVLRKVVEVKVVVTERFKKYLARDRTGVFNIYSELVGGIDLNQPEVNYRLNQFQRRALEACSTLETNWSTILNLNVEESICISTFLTGQCDFDLNFFIVSDLRFNNSPKVRAVAADLVSLSPKVNF